MKKYVIKLNDKIYEVEIEEVTGERTDTIVENERSAQSQSSAKVIGGYTIEAPMAGNIVNVKVKTGDVVSKGQVLLILEAMKMESAIVSPVDGRISSVVVTKGQAVNPGEVLVQISN